MTDLGESNATLVVAMNVALGVLVAGTLLAVVLATVKDVRERRRMRRAMPGGWPPAPSNGK